MSPSPSSNAVITEVTFPLVAVSSSQLGQLISTSTHQGDDEVHTENSKTEIKSELLFNSFGKICSVVLIKKNCAVTAVTHPHFWSLILPFYATRSKKVFRTKNEKKNQIKLLLAASFSFACEMIHHLACSVTTVLIWYLAAGYYPKYINLIRNRYCQSLSAFNFEMTMNQLLKRRLSCDYNLAILMALGVDTLQFEQGRRRLAVLS